MAIHTQQSVSGFIASDPQLTFTARGEARFYAKVGQEHYRHEVDGSFTKLETTFHDLVQFRRAAELSYAAFAKGDKFVAEGYVRDYTYEFEGQPQQGEEFIAKKLGHDTARTTYTVDRTRQVPTADRSAGVDAPTAEPETRNPASAASTPAERNLATFDAATAPAPAEPRPAMGL